MLTRLVVARSHSTQLVPINSVEWDVGSCDKIFPLAHMVDFDEEVNPPPPTGRNYVDHKTKDARGHIVSDKAANRPFLAYVSSSLLSPYAYYYFTLDTANSRSRRRPKLLQKLQKLRDVKRSLHVGKLLDRKTN